MIKFNVNGNSDLQNKLNITAMIAVINEKLIKNETFMSHTGLKKQGNSLVLKDNKKIRILKTGDSNYTEIILLVDMETCQQRININDVNSNIVREAYNCLMNENSIFKKIERDLYD